MEGKEGREVRMNGGRVEGREAGRERRREAGRDSIIGGGWEGVRR